MTIQKTLTLLVKATQEEYLQYRMQLDDSFINFIQDMLPDDYEYIKEKEEFYLKHKGLLEQLFTKKSQ